MCVSVPSGSVAPVTEVVGGMGGTATSAGGHEVGGQVVDGQMRENERKSK